MGLVFFVVSLIQVYYLYNKVGHASMDLKPIFAEHEKRLSTPTTLNDQEYLRWKTLVLLEQDVIARRYQQANSMMLARVWTRFLGFMTGMILSLVGAVFILGKLQEEPTKLESESKFGKGSLSTSSPGIVLAVMGTVLMAITLLVPTEIETRDVAVYTRSISQIPPPADFTETPENVKPQQEKTKSPAEREKELFK